MARFQTGQLVEAESSVRKSLEYQEPLVVDEPADVALRSSLGGMHNNLGMILEEMRRMDEAGESFRQAIEHQKIAHLQAADVARYRNFLNKHYYNYGRILRNLGRIDDAIQVALARRDLWPDNPQRLASVDEELALAGRVVSSE